MVKSVYDVLDDIVVVGKVLFVDMIVCVGVYVVEFMGGLVFLERVSFGRIDVETADLENRMLE